MFDSLLKCFNFKWIYSERRARPLQCLFNTLIYLETWISWTKQTVRCSLLLPSVSRWAPLHPSVPSHSSSHLSIPPPHSPIPLLMCPRDVSPVCVYVFVLVPDGVLATGALWLEDNRRLFFAHLNPLSRQQPHCCLRFHRGTTTPCLTPSSL